MLPGVTRRHLFNAAASHFREDAAEASLPLSSGPSKVLHGKREKMAREFKFDAGRVFLARTRTGRGLRTPTPPGMQL